MDKKYPNISITPLDRISELEKEISYLQNTIEMQQKQISALETTICYLQKNILKQTVNEIGNHYANEIQYLRKLISNESPQAYANSSSAVGKVGRIDTSSLYGSFHFDGWIYYKNDKMGNFLYRVREDGTGNMQLTNYSVLCIDKVRWGYLYFTSSGLTTKKLKLSRLNEK